MAVGFGKDIYVDPARGLRLGRTVEGPLLVWQALIRRLTTPRGNNGGRELGAVYGSSLREFIGVVSPDDAEAALPGFIRAEGLKDERIEELETKVTRETDSAGRITFFLEIKATLADQAGEFDLTLAINDVSAEVIGV